MVANPEERYPRAFAVSLLLLAAVVLFSLESGRWWAVNVPQADAETAAIVGWALGAGAALVVNRLARWLDSHESFLADIERRLGGDA
jgi:hypothetical protein